MNFKDIVHFMLPFLAKDKRNAIIYTLLYFVTWGFGIIMPYISGIYIDWLVDGASLPIIINFVILVGVLSVLNLAKETFSPILGTVFNNRFAYNMSSHSLSFILKSKLSSYTDADRAQLLSQVTQDTRQLTFFFSNVSVNIILSAVTVIVSAVVIFTADRMLSLIIFSLVPLYLLMYIFFQKRIYAANLKSDIARDEYFAVQLEQISKLEFIKRNHISNETTGRLGHFYEKMHNAHFKAATAITFFSSSGKAATVLCHLCVIGIGGYRVYTGNLSIGFFTMITVYFSMIISSVDYYFNLIKNYSSAKVAVTRLGRIYDEEPEVFGSKIPADINNITLCSLSLQYGETKVFDELNYTFEKGKIYAIVGENGSGKTSLMNCIVGLYSDLYTGEIMIDGVSIRDIDMPYMRRLKISFVEQFSEFINLKIDEYLALGIDFNDSVQSNQEYLIKSFELDKFDVKETINESGNNFSGGERQKLSIVRALSKESFLTILDEPTSALDDASVETLAKILQEKKNEKITLIVSHDSRMLDICNEIWHIKQKTN